MITDFWPCGRPTGKYRGKYPKGFIRRLKEIIPLEDVQVIHLFAGKSTKINPTDITVDINPDVAPDLLEDCTAKLSIKDDFAKVTLIDPPYDSAGMAYGKILYGTKFVKPYSFIKEAVRITEPGGYICILHQLVYLTPKNTERYAVISVTTGPNMRIRVLNIFKRETQTEKKLNDYG